MPTPTKKVPVGKLYFYLNSHPVTNSHDQITHGDLLNPSELAKLECAAILDVCPGDNFEVGRNVSLWCVSEEYPVPPSSIILFHDEVTIAND